MENKINFSNEKKELLRAAQNCDIPIVITGKPNSGKEEIAQYLQTLGGQLVVLGRIEYSDSPINKHSLGLGSDLGKAVVVDTYDNLLGLNGLWKIDEYINIKCAIEISTGTQFINIALVKHDIETLAEFDNFTKFRHVTTSDLNTKRDSFLDSRIVKTISVYDAKTYEALEELIKDLSKTKQVKEYVGYEFSEQIYIHVKFNLDKFSPGRFLQTLDFDTIEDFNIYVTFFSSEFNEEFNQSLQEKNQLLSDFILG